MKKEKIVSVNIYLPISGKEAQSYTTSISKTSTVKFSC